jgi:hypothetical protein
MHFSIDKKMQTLLKTRRILYLNDSYGLLTLVFGGLFGIAGISLEAFSGLLRFRLHFFQFIV